MSTRKFIHKVSALSALFAATALALTACSSDSSAPSSSASDNSTPASTTSSEATEQAADLSVVSPGKLTIALAPADPPSSYIGDDNEPTGYNVEIIKAVAADLGLEPDWKSADYSVHIPNIANGTWDTSTQGALVTEERLKQVDFSDPVDFAQAVIVSTKDSPINTFAAAEGLRIGVHTDALQTAAETNIPGVEIVKFEDGAGMLNALRAGQIDGYIYGQNNARNQAKEGDDLVLSDPITTGQVSIPLPKGNKELADSVNATLKRLAEDGTLAALHKEFYPDVEIPQDLKDSYANFQD